MTGAVTFLVAYAASVLILWVLMARFPLIRGVMMPEVLGDNKEMVFATAVGWPGWLVIAVMYWWGIGFLLIFGGLFNWVWRDKQ